MVDSSESCEKKQLIVFFDVGGVIFRVLRETIQNYPSSLLAKLVEEFPNLGYEDKPVFIDRSPKAFEWIREIYRNGDFESCTPDMSKAALERELNFYQLPNMSELGISSFEATSDEIKKAANWCGRILSEELTKRDLWKSLPLYAWFYKEKTKSERDFGAERVFLSHTIGKNAFLEVPSNQDVFGRNIDQLSDSSAEWSWIHLKSSCGMSSFLIRNVIEPYLFSMLERAASRYGLKLHSLTSISNSCGALKVTLEDSKDKATS